MSQSVCRRRPLLPLGAFAIGAVRDSVSDDDGGGGAPVLFPVSCHRTLIAMPSSSSSSFGKAFQRRLYSVFLDRSTVISIIVLSGIVFVSTLRDETVLTTEIEQLSQCLEGGRLKDTRPGNSLSFGVYDVKN